VLEQAVPLNPANHDEDPEPDREPDCPDIAGARVSREREDPDCERQGRADEGRQRKPRLADANVGPRAERPFQIRLADAQPDHGELSRGERDEDAERVDAGEERGIPVRAELGHENERDREQRSEHDRLA
jgi:hypothetical protein